MTAAAQADARLLGRLGDLLDTVEPVPADVKGVASALGARLVIRCTECDRPLSDPESRARKIGPDCWGALHPAAASTLGLRADFGEHPEQLALDGAE